MSLRVSKYKPNAVSGAGCNPSTWELGLGDPKSKASLDYKVGKASSLPMKRWIRCSSYIT